MKTKHKANSLLSPRYLKTGLAWLFLVLGIALYCIGYFFVKPETIWKEIVIKIGDIFVIGVLLGYLTSITQYLGIFKSELENIIYGREFINKRGDLPEIWENITKELFKSKFPSISKDLLSIIKDKYLPVDNVSYYNDYNVDIDVSWADKNKKLILVKNTINFDLIAESKEAFKFPLKSWICVEGLEPDDYFVKIKEYLVNNQAAEVVSNKEEVQNNCHFFEHTISLKNETKYEISKILEKKYSLEKDFTVCFKALFLINKLTLHITYPDMCATFIERGTAGNFKKIFNKPNSMKMTYKGLLLPNQGYVIALKEKNI